MTPQDMEVAIARLFAGQDLLSGKVLELTEDIAELSNAVNTTREEAEADRRIQREAIGEMRTVVTTMLGIAEPMAANVKALTQAQRGTIQRVEKFEKRVDKAEKATKRVKNGPKR